MIDSMGDKAAAKNTMKNAGVPTIPGSEGILQTYEEAEKCARDEAQAEADWNKYLATLKRRAPFGAAATVASVAVVGAAVYMSTVEKE